MQQAPKSSAEADKEAQRKAKQAADEARKKAMKSVPPQEMFKTPEESPKFSQWDADGIPTHDSSGEELSKSKKKDLKKEWDKQKKLFEGPK